MPDQQETCIGQQVGEYRLVSKLGDGSFGTVYQAEHVHEHTLAAVKVLDIRLNKGGDLKDFINEASMMMRLRHPHIVPLLNFGISRDDLPFLVTEYAPKGTLRDRHPKGERLPLLTIVSYVDQLASALQYAHDHRVIHRDVKPENILVRADGTLLVSDFGIAKLLERSILISRQKLAGTPAYMAPEQYEGYPCFASDQYALAVIVYEWICGARLFQATGPGLALQHMYTPPPRLREHLPELSEAVEHVILKALAKAPEKRFERIQEFADALREAVHRPVVLDPNIEAANTAPLITPEPLSQQASVPMSTALAPTLADKQLAHLEPATQTTDTPASPQRSTPAHHSTPQDLRSDRVLPSLQKRRLGRRLPVLVGGTLALILCLVVLVITIRPIIHVQQGPSSTPTARPTVTPTHSDQIIQKWAFPTGNAVQSSPTVVNGVVYVGSTDSQVYALDASTGQKIWTFATGASVYSSPTVLNGVLSIGSGDSKVYALDASTGQKLWVFPTGSAVQSSPTVVNGVLYVGSTDSKVYALDASTGQKLWVFPTDASVYSSPTVVNGVVYVGSTDSKVYALDASTGQKIWTFATGASVYSSPTVVNGVLYVGSKDSKVYALDASTGQKIWVFPIGNWVISSPTVVNGVLYVGSNDGKVYALDASTGQQKWASPTGSFVTSSPILANGVLYVGSGDSKVYALDASTGQKLWIFPIGAYMSSSPTVVNGVLYIGTNDGKVYAFTLPTLRS
jgi:eukaryotic-like serine/threonine-protein kinase